MAVEVVNPTQIRQHECVAGELKPSLQGIIGITQLALLNFALKLTQLVFIMRQSFK